MASKDGSLMPGNSGNQPFEGMGSGSSMNDPGAQNGAGPDKPSDSSLEGMMKSSSEEFVKDSMKEQGYDPRKGTI